jgi:hypothetical protein
MQLNLTTLTAATAGRIAQFRTDLHAMSDRLRDLERELTLLAGLCARYVPASNRNGLETWLDEHGFGEAANALRGGAQ